MRISDWSSDVCSSDLAATWQAFGRSFDIAPLLDQAHATIAFDADPLGPGPRLVLNSLRWSVRRSAFQQGDRSEEHTSELQSLMRNSYAVFCLKKNTYTRLHEYTPL